MVALTFVDFKKAFDSVCHTVLETKLERDSCKWFSFRDTSSVIWHTARVNSRAYAFYNVYERLKNVCSVRSVHICLLTTPLFIVSVHRLWKPLYNQEPTPGTTELGNATPHLRKTERSNAHQQK